MPLARWARLLCKIIPVLKVGGTIVCLFSSFLMFRIRNVRYLMAFWWIVFKRVLMACCGKFRLVGLLMECSCMAPLTLAVMVIRGLVFHPLFCTVLINGSYFVCLCVRARLGNLSWQYVNSMNWVVIVGEGAIGICVWYSFSWINGVLPLTKINDEMA